MHAVPKEREERDTRWLPVRFLLETPPAQAEWVHFHPQWLIEPFFLQSVARLVAAPHCRPRMTTDLDEVAARGRQAGRSVPAGIVFHVTRCGSTLLTNALRTAAPAPVVLSEAQPVFSLINPSLSQGKVPIDRDGRHDLLQGVVALYGQSEGNRPFDLLLKCPALSLLDIATVRAVWPKTPCVILVRDPVEVMVSMLSSPAGFMSLYREPATAREIFGWPEAELAAMTMEEYCARVLGLLYRAALASGDQTMIVDYADLNLDRILEIAAFFRLSMPPADSPALQECLRTYSKDPGRSQPFLDDRQAKQGQATRRVRHAAERWAMESYRAVRDMAGRSTP